MYALNIFFIFLLVSYSGFAANITCLYEKELPRTDSDDPFKAEPKEISSGLADKIYKHMSNEYKEQFDTYTFAATLNIGSYYIDDRAYIDYGDEGSIYLARHMDGTYVVAKEFVSHYSSFEGKLNSEAERLKKLGRLYGAYIEKKGTIESLYIFMPLIDGHNMLSYNESLSAEKTENGFLIKELNFLLLESFIAELSYIASRGINQVDQNPKNIMICIENQVVVLIDFSDPNNFIPINTFFNEDKLYIGENYKYCIRYCLGLVNLGYPSLLKVEGSQWDLLDEMYIFFNQNPTLAQVKTAYNNYMQSIKNGN